MSISSVSFSFSPAINGGSVNVTNKANLTEVKAAVLAELAIRKAAAQTNTQNLESAENSMNG